MKRFDHNLSWGRWPFRDFLYENFADFRAALAAAGIEGGLVRSAEAHFNADLYACNDRLRADVGGNFRAVPAVHPDYPRWREETAPAVALHSNFHSYALNDPGVLEMLGHFALRKTLAVIPIREEDERGQHRRAIVPPVPVAEIAAVAEAFPELEILVLNGFADELAQLAYPNVFYDFAFVERFDTLRANAAKLDAKRLVFGSHAPFFYPAAAISKLNREFAVERILR